MSAASTIPTVSEEEIRARVGEQSFQRGREYFRDRAIFDARRQGTTLKARCAGSRGNAYRLHVTFDATGTTITEADCSCPVGAGGYCKHAAALLLTWRARPEEFGEVEQIDRWEAVRPTLRLLLKELRRDDLLIQIYLDEGEVDHALEAVNKERTPGYGYGYFGYGMALEVAQAAEETRPRAALELYRQRGAGAV